MGLGATCFPIIVSVATSVYLRPGLSIASSRSLYATSTNPICLRSVLSLLMRWRAQARVLSPFFASFGSGCLRASYKSSHRGFFSASFFSDSRRFFFLASTLALIHARYSALTCSPSSFQ